MRSVPTSLAPVMSASFLVNGSNAAMTDSALFVCILAACSLALVTCMLRIGIAAEPPTRAPVLTATPESSVEMAQTAAELTDERMEGDDAGGPNREPPSVDD